MSSDRMLDFARKLKRRLEALYLSVGPGARIAAELEAARVAVAAAETAAAEAVAARVAIETAVQDELARVIPNRIYRAPDDLQVTGVSLRRILVVGSCLSEGFAVHFPKMRDGCEADYVLFNNFAQLPPQPPQPVGNYDFQILQIPMRNLMREFTSMRLQHQDLASYERFLSDCQDRLAQFLDAGLRWNTEAGLLTFVTNYMLPQQDPMGRLFPKHDLRNTANFISRLNDFLSRELAARSNIYVLDLDEIAATMGRRYIQDDVLWVLSHGATLGDADHPKDQNRLEPPRPVTDSYPVQVYAFLEAIWSEAVAMFRTLQQIDPVKLVIFDLDDTLWRGLLIEEGAGVTEATLEGWPLGLAEALTFLKKRGILLAIASKNDEQKIEAVWNAAFLDRLQLSDFAVRRINWRSKAENVAEILEATNLLARNVVFVDDNPVERAAVQQAFPDIRVLGADLYSIRRVLLWSPETQVAAVSAESGRRTEMIQAQTEREGARKRLSRTEFLQTLQLKVQVFALDGVENPRFPRAMELLNKSNQFNTTGRRWSHVELRQFFEAKGRIFAFEVADRFTAYGLVGVVLVTADGRFEQFVMSCRVIGLDVETSVVTEISRRLAGEGLVRASATVIHTDANQLARDLFVRSGMAPIDDQAGDQTYLAEIAALPPAAGHIALD